MADRPEWRQVDADAPAIVRDVAEGWEPYPGQNRFFVFYGASDKLYCLASKGGWKSGAPKMWIELPFTD